MPESPMLSAIGGGMQLAGNESLVLAVAWVIRSIYGRAPAAPLSIAQYAGKTSTTWYHYDLIEAVLLQATKHIAGERDFSKKFVVKDGGGMYGRNTSSDEGDGDYTSSAIWFVDSMAAFHRLEEDLLNPLINYQRNGYFCMVYTGTEPRRTQNIKFIFRRFFEIYITNINVFLLIGNVPYAYTYFPFTPNKCHSSKPELYTSFHSIRDAGNFSLGKLFFPHKVRNMYGCELVVATWDQPPFMIIERDNRTGELVRLHGIEGMIMTYLAEKINFTMRIVAPSNLERGAIFENGTTTGATRMIVEGEANITILFYMQEKKRSEYMLASFSYLSASLVLAIPMGKPMSPFKRLVKPFKYIIWSCFSTSLAMGVVAIFTLKVLRKTHFADFVFGHRNRIPFTNFWNSLYGGAIPGHLPRRNFARYLLTVWLLYTLVIRSAYTGELYIMLQDGRAPVSMQSFEEIVAQNYTVYTVPPLVGLLSDTLQNAHIRFIDGFENSMPNIMYRLNTSPAKETLTVIEIALKAHNQRQTSDAHRVAILPQKLLMAPLTLYMRQHSYLHKRINDLLLDLMCSGIVRKYEQHYVYGDNDRLEQHQPTKLSLWLLLGIFTVYLVLLALCFFVFLLELWSKRSPVAETIVDFLNI